MEDGSYGGQEAFIIKGLVDVALESGSLGATMVEIEDRAERMLTVAP